MPGILYAAYQKFYSALNCLERFDKEKDFFENISNLDGFFSEFRNITFVLQKAVAHTEYAPLYEKNRDKYLMMTYTLLNTEKIQAGMTSRERISCGTEDYLVFMKVDQSLEEEECFFESSKLKDYTYISHQLEAGSKRLNLGRINMLPVIQAFRKKRDISQKIEK